MPRANPVERQDYERRRNRNDPARRAYWKKYYHANKEKERERKRTPHGRKLRKLQSRRKRLRYKLQAFDAYGGRLCACCGETILDFLSLDHKNVRREDEYDKREHPNGGRRKLGGFQLYRLLKRLGWPPGYQVLCMNCNWGKRTNGGVCPHKEMASGGSGYWATIC